MGPENSLIMNEFMSYMGNFLIALSFCAVCTLILTFAYIFIFKPYDKDDDESF